jgi:hypothetical protein
MLIELSAKGFFITAVIDALLKFSNESGCQGLNVNSSMAQFEGKEEVVFRRSWERCLIHGYLKIDERSISSFGTNQLINLFGEIEGFIKEEGISFDSFPIEANRKLSSRT